MSRREVVVRVTNACIGAAGALLDRLSVRRRQLRRSEGAAGDAPSEGRVLLGRYRLVRVLGRGAMGTVHVGHDLQRGIPVAVKTLPLSDVPDGEGGAGETRARFFQEARAAQRLRHPGIVTVFEAGEDAGLAFIAMELLAGSDLVPWTRAGSLLPVSVVLETVAQAALALGHAHRAGVVHRDIKPANVMLDRSTGAVKVTDFGIARLADAERTRTGVLLGTPFYMSPEQLAGGPVDGRSDLYSLGVLLYELLTGTLPYRDGASAALFRQIAETPAPDIRDRRPELPGVLAETVALALQKRPGLRHARGEDFAADLRAVARRMAEGPDPAPP